MRRDVYVCERCGIACWQNFLREIDINHGAARKWCMACIKDITGDAPVEFKGATNGGVQPRRP